MINIIDGDFIPYTFGFIADRDFLSLSDVLKRVDLYLIRLFQFSGNQEYIGYLGASRKNYRNDLKKDYKDNRDTMVRPNLHKEIKDYLIEEYSFNLVKGIESDDAVGITSTAIKDCTIISTDKDLLQLPGKHINCKKVGGFENITVEYPGIIEFNQSKNKIFATGLYLIFAQTLKGDVADGYGGLKGWGEKKTYNLLKDCNPENLLNTVLNEYRNVYGDDAKEKFRIMWNMAYLCRENPTFKIPSSTTLKSVINGL